MDIVSKANRLERPKVLSIPIRPEVYEALRRVGRSFGVSPTVYARGILEDFYDQYLAADQASEGGDLDG